MKKLLSKDFDTETDRAFGALFGLVVGDALGAPLEFSPVRYGATELTGFSDELWKKNAYNRFKLKPGQWTDDASMSFCLAESLLAKKGFSAHDLRLRFLNWWQFGYCNAFGFDALARGSVGLGGNISESFSEFVKDKTEYTAAGDLQTSGNGSIMRNAPVALYYAREPQEADKNSYKQSKTTHQGEEAAECARLLTHCIIQGINGDGTAGFLDKLDETFESKLYSITCMTEGRAEKRHKENAELKLAERNWDWKSADHKYAPGRSKEQPGYIGSYSMDGLAMALHCVYTTKTLEEAMLKCINMRGDADTTGAITGQIAGAIYGVSAIPDEWIKTVMRWDPKGYIPLRAWRLYHHDTDPKLSASYSPKDTETEETEKKAS
eukprot:TRINITY_DN4185_c0_g1_i1.p1 TRINITY_DN4185_c0_g1~~TRINITY_DN4185_c0_g1_i1.p1  ORF type:complete len:436 (+),score=91.33 TRINITY_DN4185_c0_g1_i1:173-1309(+)